MTASVGELPLALRDAQRLLFDAVTAGGPPEPRLCEIVAENGLPAPRRVAIYRDGYRARLLECLADDYPAVQHALGGAAFEALCHDYIRDVPPGVSLNDYGVRFAEYCLHRAPCHAALVSELAQLEWALVKAVHQSDARQLMPDDLAELTLDDWESASLVPSPTLTLLATQYPVNAYLQAFRDDRAPEVPVSPMPSWVVVCRHGVDVWRIELPVHLGELFAALVSGEPLAQTLASVASNPAHPDAGDGVSAIQQAFSQWMRAGCFSGVARARAS